MKKMPHETDEEYIKRLKMNIEAEKELQRQIDLGYPEWFVMTKFMAASIFIMILRNWWFFGGIGLLLYFIFK